MALALKMNLLVYIFLADVKPERRICRPNDTQPNSENVKIEIERFGRLNLTESINSLKLSSGKYRIKLHLILGHPTSTTFEPLMICYQVQKDEILSVELSEIFLKYLSKNLMKEKSGNSYLDC
jgi:hypothetical protein